MRKALIIDSDPALVEGIARLVQDRHGLSPVMACDLETALELAPHFDYALIVSGTLAEQTGDCWKWLIYLREQHQLLGYRPPLVAITGQTEAYEIYRRPPLRDLEGYIFKPTSWLEIAHETRQVLAGKTGGNPANIAV